MLKNTHYLLLREFEIIDILAGNSVKNFKKETELQKHIADLLVTKEKNQLLLIEEWSYEKMPGKDVRRKHDLVFLNLGEFPPVFWIIEVKKKFAKEDHPFSYFYEAKKRAEIWEVFGVKNVVPLYVLPAPESLQYSPLLPSYSALISFLRQQDDKRIYDVFEVLGSDEREIWGDLDNDDIESLDLNELKDALRRRSLSFKGNRKTLETNLINSQKEIEKKEGTVLTFLDINLNSVQDWSISNGITRIRVFNSMDMISIIIVPPCLPEVIYTLYELSKGAGGDNYDFWDLETNKNIEDPPDTREKMKQLLNRMKEEENGFIYGNLGIEILKDNFTDINEYEWVTESIRDTLESYMESWKEIKSLNSTVV